MSRGNRQYPDFACNCSPQYRDLHLSLTVVEVHHEQKVPGGGRGPGLGTPCASSLLLKSLVAGVMLDQVTRALDGSCSGAGHASCSCVVEGMLGHVDGQLGAWCLAMVAADSGQR